MEPKAPAAPAQAPDPHRLDGLLYRLKDMGAAVECIGVLMEVGKGDERDAQRALQGIGEILVETTAGIEEEVSRITGKAF